MTKNYERDISIKLIKIKGIGFGKQNKWEEET